MLAHVLNQRVNYLSRRIKSSCKNWNEQLDDRGNIDAKINWCAPHLFAELLSHSTLKKKFPNRNDLDSLYDSYPNKTQVNLQGLFDKLWLREVMNRIVIAGKVYAMQSDLKMFDEKRIGDNISPSQTEYFNFLIDNREGLAFIRSFTQHFAPYKENGFVIDQAIAENIISTHCNTYPLCPSFKELSDNNFFHFTDDECVFTFKRENDHGESFRNEILGLTWNRLVAIYPEKDKDELLDSWLDIVEVVDYNRYPSKCIKFMVAEAAKEFINLIRQRILNENDLKDIEREIEKVQLAVNLDSPLHSGLTPIQVRINTNQTLEEKYKLVEEVRAIPNSNFFFIQRERIRVDLLISILIQSEKTKTAYRREDAKAAFPLTIELLKEGNTRPHLLYELPMLIRNWRPEIIPYLLIHKDLELIGMDLGREINISNASIERYEEEHTEGNSVYSFKTQLWEEMLYVLLSHFVLNRVSEEKFTVSLIVLALSKLARDSYNKPLNSGRSPSQKLKYERYLTTWNILRQFREGSSGISAYGHDRPTFIARCFESLTELICSALIPPYHVEFFTPHLWLLDMHIQLIKSLNDPLVFNKTTLRPEIATKVESCQNALIKSLHKHYLSFFTYSEMYVKDHWLNVEKKKAKFYLNTYGINRVEWPSYLQSLDSTELTEFIYAVKDKFDLSGIRETYLVSGDEVVRDLREKYYYHLNVLNCAYIQARDSKDDLEEISQSIEKRITEIIYDFSQTVLEGNKVNIFDKNSELFSGGNLFEEVIESVASFSPKNRKKVIDVVAKNVNALDRIFIAFNLLTSEGDRQLLLKKIDKVTLDTYLEEQNWLPNIQGILLHSIDAPELTDFAEQILKYIEPKLRARQLDDFTTQHLYFRIKLLLAYRKKDKNAIETLEAPKNPSPSHYSGFYYNVTALRTLYLAALEQDDSQYEEAYKKFSLLLVTNPENSQIASNKFGCAIEVAKSKETSEQEKELSNALNEWKTFEETNLKNAIGLDRRFIQLCKLECFYLLKKYDEIDVLLQSISKVNRYSKPFAEFIFKSKMDQHRYNEGSVFVNELEIFHRHRSEELPEFIVQFRKDIGNDEDLKRLRNAYSNILNQAPENLIKTLPQSISERGGNLGDFLLDEILLAAKAMQSKLIAEIKGENKLTDILQLMINARISAWRMYWSSQERQGNTQTYKGNPASVDLASNMQHHSFPLEAVRFDKTFGTVKGKLQSHILKNFDHTASRKFLFNIIYYQHRSFSKDWEKFYKAFLPCIKFNKEFELVQPIEAINWNSITPNLKACKSYHNNGVVCYYVFIDLTLFDKTSKLSITKKRIPRDSKN